MRELLTLTNSERMSLTWRKAQRSTNDGACVEVASVPGKVAVRDSKDPGGPVLVYEPEEWSTFLREVKKGAFAI